MVTHGSPYFSRIRLRRANQMKHTRLAVALVSYAATLSPRETKHIHRRRGARLLTFALSLAFPDMVRFVG